MTPPDTNNAPQDNGEELLKKAYQEVTKKFTSAHESTWKALGEMKEGLQKQVLAKYEDLRLAIREQLAYKSVEDALTELKTEKYKKILAEKGIELRTADFYLGLVRKESGFAREALSKSNAKGLFQLKVDVDEETGKESCAPINDINKFYKLDKTTNDIFCEKGEPKDFEKAAQENALVGILFWHRCRDGYGENLKSDWSASDKDKLGNMIYNMGSGNVKNLLRAVEDEDKPFKNFKEFAIKVAEKLHEAYPDDLENETKSIKDPVLDTSYNRYVKIRTGFELRELGPNPDDPEKKKMIDKTVDINGIEFKLPKILEAIKYSELVYSLSQPKPQPKVLAPAPSSAQVPNLKLAANAPQEYYTLGKEFKSVWGVANDMYNKYMLDFQVPFFSKAQKINIIVDMISAYNKLKNNKDFNKENSKVYIPTPEFVSNYFKNLPKAAPAPAPAPTAAPSKAPSSAPHEVAEKNDVMPKGVPMYSGPDAAGLEAIGKEPIKYVAINPKNGKEIPRDLNTPPCELKIPNKPYKNEPMDINNPPRKDKKTNPSPKYYGEKMEKEDVKYIVLHATLGVGVNLEKNAEHTGIHETQGAHYLVRKDGTVENLAREWIDPNIKDEKERKAQKRVGLNHAGLNGSEFGSIWNDEEITYESVGIEVEAAIGEEYNEAQYAALKQLIEWIGARYEIPKANVLTHSMIASHPSNGRGRKADPSRLKWAKLGLPDNYRRIDPDVATGKVPSNIGRIKSDIKNKENDWGLSNADASEITGLEASDKIWKDKVAAAKPAKKKNK